MVPVRQARIPLDLCGQPTNLDKMQQTICPQHQPNSTWQIRCELFGALAATGHGHGTHRAVLAGLMGCTPTSVDTEQLTNFFETVNEQYTLDFEQTQILFTENDIFFDYGFNPYRHPNTLKLVLLVNYTPVLTQVFYSVGGGFIEQEGGTKEAIGKTNVAHKSLTALMIFCV